MREIKFDEKEVEWCVHYLAETEKEYGKAKGRMKAAEPRKKTAKATAYLKAEGTQGDREQQAYVSQEYIEAVNEIYNATMDYEILDTGRRRAELTIEVWRSLNSARKKGNIV